MNTTRSNSTGQRTVPAKKRHAPPTARPANGRGRRARASARIASWILEYQSTAALLLDRDLRLLTLNPAAEELLGLSATQSEGHCVLDLMPGCSLLWPLAGRALESGEALTERDVRVFANEDGSPSADCVLTPVRTDGRVDSVLVELWQLDRHKQLARDTALNAQHEAARDVLRGLAHEIKNPLGGIRGAAQLLELELGEHSLTEYTRVIVREADRLSNLVDRMLGPRSVPRLAGVNLHEIMERVCALAEMEAPPGVRLVRDYDPSIPDLYADAELLIQAALNVTRNALQAVGGNGRIVIRTRVHRQASLILRHHRIVAGVEIVDDGPGVDPAIEGRIFYPLVSGRSDGTGLGLSIAQTIVAQHGGAIEHRRRASGAGGETVFSILLPVAEDGVGADLAAGGSAP